MQYVVNMTFLPRELKTLSIVFSLLP
jgi:hypothetical protein